MTFEGFVLAATTNDLRREPRARDAADAIEFRLDRATDPIAQLEAYNGSLPVLATNRAAWAGGDASADGRLDRLVAASRFEHTAFVDIELASARSRAGVLDDLRETGVEVIVSHHDFEATPERDRLDTIFEACARHGDIGKVAVTPHRYADVLDLLGSLTDATETGLTVGGLSMGAIGAHSRVVGPLYGSKLGYAPLESDTTEYAPGQIPLSTLRDLIGTIERNSEGPTPARRINGSPTSDAGRSTPANR